MSLLRILPVLVCMVLLSQQVSQCYETEDVVSLRATAGRNAYLPCGQEKVFLDGPGSYIAWMKDDQFIYRFPNDETEPSTHGDSGLYYGDSADNSDVCERSRSCVDRTSLHLRSVTRADAGVYSCRVHYVSMPSVDYVIGVVVVPCPRNPRFYSDDIETSTGYIGPIALGTDLKFMCELDQADNDTILYWRRNGEILSEQSRPVSQRPLTILYSSSNISRDELDAQYECVAQNSDVSEPITATLTVKMFMPPLSVEIRMNDNFDFAAGEPRVVDCVMVGCVPPPTVTWHLGDKLLKSSSHKEHHEGNFTVSSLSVSPALSDQGSSLVCRAHNPYVRDQVYQHAVTINVGYKPVCLRIREETIGVVDSESEVITCMVEAAPEPVQFTWSFGSTRKAYTTVKRISGHKHRYSSTLTFRATTEDIGSLECRAVSSFGTQEQPCIYKLVPGGAPEAPTCLLLKSDPKAGRIECKKGFDGGRTQTIHLHIVTDNGVVLVNRSNSLGHFHLQELEEKTNLTAHVFASSSRGKSHTVKIDLRNWTPSLKKSSSDTSSGIGYHVIVTTIIEGVAAIVLVVGIIALAVMLCKKNCNSQLKEHPDSTPHRAPQEQCPDIVPISRTDGSFHRQPDPSITRDDHTAINITYSPFDQCRITSEMNLPGTSRSTPSNSEGTLVKMEGSTPVLLTSSSQARCIKQRTFFV